MRKYSLLIILGLCCNAAVAQISVVDNQTAQALAQSLVGQGVIMLNPTMNGTCPSFASGKFNYNGNPSNIGIDSGIVLTSGRAVTAGAQYGVNAAYSDFANNTFPGGTGDPDLTALINENAPVGSYQIPTNDACILEFDFIPAGDSVQFQYVFASEEYDCPTCSWNFNCSINDVFGFFISGPGIPTPTNIALVPGSPGVMVGVSTVNDGVSSSPGNACDYNTFGNGPYTQYYNDNAGSTDFVYSGYTDVFSALAGVIPCDTYHLKLAIADASDNAYDSGVFLKAGSLNSVGIKLTAESTAGHNTPVPHCIRGCKSAEVVFRRPMPRPAPLTIHYLIGGDAQPNVDYQAIADSIVIPAFQDSAILSIKGLLTSVSTGPKRVIIKALSPYTCSSLNANVIDSATVTIFDSLYVNITSPPVTVCPNTEVTINAEIDTTLDYQWAPEALIPDPPPLGLTIHPKPTVPTTYTITVTMPGAPATCPPNKRSYFANVEPIPNIVLPTVDTTVCLADSIDLNVAALPEGIDYNFEWSPATHLRDNFSTNNKFFAPPGDYHLTLTATTPIAGCTNSADMTIHVVPPFSFNSVSPKDTTINYGDTIQLSSESEAIYWLWDPVTYLSDPISESPYASPLKSIVYTLVGINQYGCRDTANVKINVQYESLSGMPNAFSPNGDGMNDVFKIQNLKFEKLLSFRIYDRWGHLIFETSDYNKGWDGTINGTPAAADTYFYLIQLALPGGNAKNFKGDVTLIR